MTGNFKKAIHKSNVLILFLSRCKALDDENEAVDLTSLVITFDEQSTPIYCSKNAIDEMINITAVMEDALVRYTFPSWREILQRIFKNNWR